MDEYPCKCGGKITWDYRFKWWDCDGCDFPIPEEGVELPEEFDDGLP